MGREKEAVSRASSAPSPDFRPKPPSLSPAPWCFVPTCSCRPDEEEGTKDQKWVGSLAPSVSRAHL